MSDRRRPMVRTGGCLVLAAVTWLAVVASVAWGCGSDGAKTTSDATLLDLSRVTTNHPIYVAIGKRGVFRFRLNLNNLEPLAIHEEYFADFKMSPSGRYLVYDTNGVSTDRLYVYDLHHGVDRQITGLPAYARIMASPDDRWLAGIPRPTEPAVVWLLDLDNAKVEHFAVPSASESAWFGGSGWSTGGDLLFTMKERNSEIFWSFTPKTKEFSIISGYHKPPAKTIYLQSAQELQTVCEWCGTQHDLPIARVAGGVVSATPHSLVFRKSGMPDKVVAAVAPPPDPVPGHPMITCGYETIHLADVFDDRYLLVAFGRSFRIYDVVENRTAALPIPPSSPVVWQ